MKTNTLLMESMDSKWILFFVVNGLLSLVLWFVILTDYSWTNPWVDLFFLPFVGVLGLISWKMFRKSSLPNRRFGIAICEPSMVIGIFSFLPILLIIVSFWFFGIWPPLDAYRQEFIPDRKLIEKVVSPNGNQTAYSYSYVNEYLLAGFEEVFTVNNAFPALKKQVYKIAGSGAPKLHVVWIDDDAISINGDVRILDLIKIEIYPGAYIYVGYLLLKRIYYWISQMVKK